MILQPHQIKEPIPKDARPGDLAQWAVWYMGHLLNGGLRLDGQPLRPVK